MGHRTQRSTCYLIVYFKYFVTYLNTGVSRGQWKITAAAIVRGHLIYLLREVQITVIMFYNTAEYDVLHFNVLQGSMLTIIIMSHTETHPHL